MADFEKTREDLSDRLNGRATARERLLGASEQLKKTEARLAALNRRFNPRDPKTVQEREALLQRQKLEQARVLRLQGERAEAGRHLEGIWAEFQPFTDPRENLRRLNDGIPILLLPLRLETRFQSIDSRDGTRVQLRVRVYPDDCSIDTFEPLLSDGEAVNTRRFWAGWWAAAGDEARQRDAWRMLVGSHGSGRAGYLVQQYKPRNTAPEKAQPQDVALVIVDAVGLTPPEREPLAAYWRAVWLADGDRALNQQARQVLEAAVGAERADVLRGFRPQNLGERPPKPFEKGAVGVQVAFAEFPTEEEFPTKRLSWTQPARARLLPDRLVLLAYRNNTLVHEILGERIPAELIVGPDPQDPEQFKKEDGVIQWSEEVRWIVDFEDAVARGMGFRIDLTPEEAQTGFDRILVLGVRMGSGPNEAATQLENLLQNHQRSRAGFALLPQGVPTNNSETEGSFFERTDDPEDSFDVFLRDSKQFDLETNDARKRDGQWLAQWLGIRPAALERTPHAGQRDQAEARAMQVALWPATLGYFFESLLQPVLDDRAIEFVRDFFVRYVSGRGPVPAVRVGRQPYGIQPAAAFARLAWFEQAGSGRDVGRLSWDGARLQRLHAVLTRMESDWRRLVEGVSFVGRQGEQLDPHQMLLDILGLHPSSEEFHYRYAYSLEYLLNHFRLLGFGSEFEAGLRAWLYRHGGLHLLNQLGYEGGDSPEILDKFFFSKQHLLSRFLIDDVPLSETALVRSYTTDPAESGNPAAKNYLRWLREAASTSLDALRRQEGFWNNQPPQVLLYLLLRHALLMGYHDTGLRVLRSRGVLDTAGVRRHKTEARFISIAEKPAGPESRWEVLYQPVLWQTGVPNQSLADHVTVHLGALAETHHLQDQMAALERLENVPTARLERLLVEHLDCCSYRLDAWRTGLLHLQLDLMRAQTPRDNGSAGIHLGAYGWLNNVRPENRPLTPVQLTPEQAEFFLKTDPRPPMRDGRNDGHILAPSLNQAVTAAILRNGYRANVVPGEPGVLAIDLSSRRVREALGILEGMRNGQKLGALLGYRFERALHERTDGLELDRFILPFRQAFPLAARRLRSTQPPEGTPVEAIDARNVLDGLALVRHLRGGGPAAYPYGKSEQLPSDASPAERAALDHEISRLLALQDAVADLAMAESVHQVVLGNYERSAANLDGYAGAATPPEPDVVRTPRSGRTVTHRVAIHLDSMAVAPAGASPRALGEPGVHSWLSAVLPDPAELACIVEYQVRNAAGATAVAVSAADLQLQPLDLLYQYAADRSHAATSLDDRIIARVVTTVDLHPGSAIHIRYTAPVAGRKTFWELNPLLESLMSLLLGARPLEAADVRAPSTTTTDLNSEPELDPNRVLSVRQRLENFLANQVQPLETELDSRFEPAPVQEEHLVGHVEEYLDQFAALVPPAGDFGLAFGGFSDLWNARQQIFTHLMGSLAAYIGKWEGKLGEFDALLLEASAATGAGKLELLLRAERTLSTLSTDPSTIGDPDLFAATLQASTRGAFTARLEQFRDLVAVHGHALPALILAAEALDTASFDAEALQFAEDRTGIVRLVADLRDRTRVLREAVEKRLAAAGVHWDAHLAAPDAVARVKSLIETGKALLGEDFRMFPSFSLRTDHGHEWANAWTDRAALLTHAQTLTAFPVDDWLYGVARVRERMRHYENVLMLCGAFGTSAPELTPLQFPYASPPDYHWMAVELPEGVEPLADVLLYTAHDTSEFNEAARQCGALIDEWTEVIPMANETVGLAFHYDRPNCEAPQAWLLVTPASVSGAWRWADLVDALHDTLDLARLRAIEPAFLDPTVYAPFLPATVSATASREVTITANFALAANLAAIIPSS
jgi:hypothetical protein